MNAKCEPCPQEPPQCPHCLDGANDLDGAICGVCYEWHYQPFPEDVPED